MSKRWERFSALPYHRLQEKNKLRWLEFFTQWKNTVKKEKTHFFLKAEKKHLELYELGQAFDKDIEKYTEIEELLSSAKKQSEEKKNGEEIKAVEKEFKLLGKEIDKSEEQFKRREEKLKEELKDITSKPPSQHTSRFIKGYIRSVRYTSPVHPPHRSTSWANRQWSNNNGVDFKK